MKGGECKMSQVNQVFIGKKPLMNYVVACLHLLNHGANEIVLKARGKAISKAVDTAEMLRRVFAKGLAVKKIDLNSEEVTRQDGRKALVSTIEILLAK